MSTPETEKKLEFLNQLLEKNPELRNQYETFARKDTPGDVTDAESYIAEQTGKLVFRLEALDLSDPDWENYTPRHSGYIEDWEAYMHVAEDKINEVFDAYMTKIEGCIANGRTDFALLCIVGGYNACLQSEIQDEYDSLGDPQSYLIDTMRNLQAGLIQKMEKLVFPNHQVLFFTDALFSHFNNHHQGNDGYLGFFEPLMLALCRDKECAQHMEREIAGKGIPRNHFPQLATQLYKITDNKEKWREEAERLFEADVEVARDLLAEYSENSYDNFIRVARQLWSKALFKQELASYVFKQIDPKKSPGFYKEVLLWLTTTNRSLSRYKLLETILSDQEKEDFIYNHKRDHLFYVEMLAQDQRYDEILQFIKSNLNSWKFNKMVAITLKPYPEESFQILKQKIFTTLDTQRGRNVYRQIVEWLLLARQISGMKVQTKQLVHHLFNWKPALPALKDEMRQAGFRLD